MYRLDLFFLEEAGHSEHRMKIMLHIGDTSSINNKQCKRILFIFIRFSI